jgi:predicted CoA-binding protein
MSKPTTLVIGASENPDRYAYMAVKMLQQYNQPVFAFGNKKGKINDTDIVTFLPERDSIDTVTLYLSPKNQESIMQQILFINPRRIIFNPGTENPEFIQKATDLGIETIEACTLVMLRTNQY